MTHYPHKLPESASADFEPTRYRLSDEGRKQLRGAWGARFAAALTSRLETVLWEYVNSTPSGDWTATYLGKLSYLVKGPYKDYNFEFRVNLGQRIIFIRELTFSQNTLNQEEQTMTPNYSTAILLFNDDVRGVTVSYDRDPTGKGLDLKTYKTFRTDLEVGDLVVVPTKSRHRFTIVRVEAVDVEIDPTTTENLLWITAKYDPFEHDEVLAKEKELIAYMKKAEQAKRKRELRESFGYLEEDEALKGLAAYNIKEVPAIEGK